MASFKFQIGDVQLSGSSVPAEFSRKLQYKFDEATMLDGTPDYRGIGAEPASFSCEVQLTPNANIELSPDRIVERLSELAAKLQPVPVIMGTKTLGFYTIRSIDPVTREMNESGSTSMMDLKMELKESPRRNGAKWEWESTPKAKWD